MGIFGRIKSLFNGFWLAVTGKAEERNPELLLADAEERIRKSRKEAEKQLLEIQTWAETVRMEMKQSEVQLSDIRAKILLARKAKDRDLMIELLMQEEELERLVEQRKCLHENAVAEALRVRDNYKRFEADMNAKMQELSTIKSQSRLVAMREKIAATDCEYGSEHTRQSIERLRQSINQRCARITATQQLKADSNEEKIKLIDRSLAYDKAAEKADMLLIEA